MVVSTVPEEAEPGVGVPSPGGAEGARPRQETPSAEAPHPARQFGGLTSQGLDRRERLAGLAGAGLAAVAFAVVWVPHLNQPTAKGHQAAAVYLAVGLVEALVLAGCTLAKRRYLVGFASLVLAFGPWNAYFVLAFPFLALAGWTLFRATRLARSTGATRRGSAGRAVTRPDRGHTRPDRGSAARPRRAAGRGGGERPRRSGRGRDALGDATGRRRPEASKRYTPPKS